MTTLREVIEDICHEEHRRLTTAHLNEVLYRCIAKRVAECLPPTLSREAVLAEFAKEKGWIPNTAVGAYGGRLESLVDRLCALGRPEVSEEALDNILEHHLAAGNLGNPQAARSLKSDVLHWATTPPQPRWCQPDCPRPWVFNNAPNCWRRRTRNDDGDEWMSFPDRHERFCCNCGAKRPGGET